MFCSKCGNEINDGQKFCSQCGMIVTQSENKEDVMGNSNQKVKGSKKILVILGIILVLILAVVAIGINTNSKTQKSIIEKLQKITKAYKDENRCYFDDIDGAWTIIYTSENEVVNLKNDMVKQCFENIFGNDCYSENGVSNLGFAYDLRDDESLIFLNVDVDEGHLSIIAYNFEEDEYRAMINGEWWDATDEFIDFVEEQNLLSAMEKDISKFKSTLKENGLTVSDLLELEYESLKKQSFTEKNPLSVEEEVVDAKTENKESSVDENKFVGKYIDSDGSSLTICKINDDYIIAVDIVRLTSIKDGLSISVSDKKMTFTATDAAGNPIGGKLEWSNNYSDLKYTIIESTWDYLPNGTEMNFQKSSDNEVHEVEERWYIEQSLFFSMQSDTMLEISCANDIMLHVTVYCEGETLSHIFDVEPNETGEYDELTYFSEDGCSIVYYPSTQSVYYDNGEGLFCGMYYSD